MNHDFDTPDFSGDDFANDPGVQKARAEAQAHAKMIDDSIAIVQKNLGLAEASHKNLKKFLMFKRLEPIITHSMASANLNMPLHVSVAEYTSSVSTGKYVNTSTDLYLFGHFTLNKSFPATYICKETIREKITNLFLRNEVDFRHSKKFSRKFHVLTDNRDNLQHLLQFKDLDTLAAYPHMELEIQDTACLFRSSNKAISPEEAVVFCNLVKALTGILR